MRLNFVRRGAPAMLASVSLFALCRCAAIYPEIQTPLRAPNADQRVEPPPPRNLRWLALQEANIPDKTRDGRPWRDFGKSVPDAFVRMFLNGQEIIRTDPEPSLTPTWPTSPRGNFFLPPHGTLRVELWDSAFTDEPICIKDLATDNDDDWRINNVIHISCASGASLDVAYEPAHPRVGYGFYYELRTENRIFVTRVFRESPAYRAQLRPGEEITALNGRVARTLSLKDIDNELNTPRLEGIKLRVVDGSGIAKEISMKTGGVYPTFDEFGTLP